ncbi:MAG: flagellar biosynthesis protein FlgN [Paracoccaceae bacterium]
MLVAERALLITGDFKALERLEADKEKVIAAIRPMSERDLQELSHLRGLAEHNQQLFKQALKGIQDVADRLESIRKIGETIDTYDQTGRRISVETQQSKALEKRA